jgi:hypothetical protein
MVKIGIVALIPYGEITKYFANVQVLEYVENTYNVFIEGRKFNKSDIILVSNGYPWINHVPVTLFLANSEKDVGIEKEDEYAGIELCMPTEVNSKTKSFLNTHEGRTLNLTHGKYKEVSQIDSLDNLARIVQAQKSNKKSIIKRGFKQANTMMVRNCDHILVFGLTAEPEGEFWDKIHCEKEYYDITNLLGLVCS